MSDKRRNIVTVELDTFRVDCVGCHLGLSVVVVVRCDRNKTKKNVFFVRKKSETTIEIWNVFPRIVFFAPLIA